MISWASTAVGTSKATMRRSRAWLTGRFYRENQCGDWSETRKQAEHPSKPKWRRAGRSKTRSRKILNLLCESWSKQEAAYPLRRLSRLFNEGIQKKRGTTRNSENR